MTIFRSRRAYGLLAIAVLFHGCSARSWAQDKKIAPPVASGLPTLNFSLPLGCQRGVEQELILTGSKLSPTVQFWPGCFAKCTVIADEKLEKEGKVKVKLLVPVDTRLGLYPSRVLTPGGLSNMKVFAVDDLPQVIDNDANHDKTKPQEIQTPCVVAGRTDAETSDYYKFQAKAGERLSFEILGRRLGSPIDPLIVIHGGKALHELAYDNDSPGCQGDPRLTYVFKEAGEYLVEVRDVLSRGGPDFVYRLRIGDFPLATVPVPMAAKAGSKVRVEFAGIYVDGVKPVEVDVLPDLPAGSVVWVTPKAAGLPGWPVPLIVSDVDELVEKEPNQTAAQSTRMSLPGGATGRFTPGDAVDMYVVAVKKGQKIAIEGHTLEWGSPTMLYFSLKNAKGAEVGKSNPTVAPPGDQRIEFTPTEDGDLFIEVQHLLYQGGPVEAYHLSVRPVGPFLEVVLSIDKAEAAAGSAATLPFTINRKGFAGAVDVRVFGDDAVIVKLKANQAVGVLPIPSLPDAPLGTRGIFVEARAVIDGKPVAVFAHARPILAKSMAGLVYPGFDMPTRVAVAVKEKAPFSLSAKLDPAEFAPGSTPNVIVTATRDKGFDAEIAINPPVGLPANVTAKILPIPKDKTEVKFPLDVTNKALLGEFYVLLSGKAKDGKRDITSDPALLHVVIASPFDIAVDPATIDLAPGGKTKITLKATRKHGYKGVIGIELKNLPATITGGKTTIAADQNSVEIELAAPPTLTASQTEIEIVGTALALANLQTPTGAFTLRVGKK